MTVKTLSTPQVSALLSISMPTLARYAKIYNKHLSGTASQHKRGRRWTPDDIEKVILINRLGLTRMGVDRINNILEQDPNEFEEKPSALLTSNQVLEIATNVLSEVEEQRRAINKMIQRAEFSYIDYVKFAQNYKRDIKLIHKKLDDQNFFTQKVMMKLTYQTTRNPDMKWMQRAADQVEAIIKNTLPEDFKRAIDPPTWLDDLSRYDSRQEATEDEEED